MSSLSNAFRNGSCSRVTKSVLSYVSYENGFLKQALFTVLEKIACAHGFQQLPRGFIQKAMVLSINDLLGEKFMVKSVIIVVLQ